MCNYSYFNMENLLDLKKKYSSKANITPLGTRATKLSKEGLPSPTRQRRKDQDLQTLQWSQQTEIAHV